MDDGDNLDWLPGPQIADHIGIEIRKAVAAVQQLVVKMTDCGDWPNRWTAS
jgi:hypothetical protein